MRILILHIILISLITVKVHGQETTPQQGVYVPSTRWENGTEIKVKFIGGSEYVRKKVETYSKEWENYANITFKYIKTGTADIIITFDKGESGKTGRSWSHMGKQSQQLANLGKATMNFGWFDDSTAEKEFSRTILHEFGHALGLEHEHVNPLGHEIIWNESEVYKYFYAMGWDNNTIKNNVLETPRNIDYTTYDPLSIMHYEIPEWLTLNGYSVKANHILSEGDKKIIAEMYPKPTIKGNIFDEIIIEHDVLQNNKKGMRIIASFTIQNSKGNKCELAAYFYNELTNEPLKDKNNSYNTESGNVATSEQFIPNNNTSKYKEFSIFIPYSEFHISESGKYKFKFNLIVWNNKKLLLESGYYSFPFKTGIICDNINIASNVENETEIINISSSFSVENAENTQCNIKVHLLNENGAPIKSANNKPVQFVKSFNVKSQYATFNNYEIHVPFNSINIPIGHHKIKYVASLEHNGEIFAKSDTLENVFLKTSNNKIKSFKCSIDNITTEKIIHQTKGISISAHLTLIDTKYDSYQMTAYFYTEDGRPLIHKNQNSSSKTITSFVNFKMNNDEIQTIKKIFMPYDNLLITQKGDHRLKYKIIVWGDKEKLLESNYQFFTFTKEPDEIVIEGIVKDIKKKPISNVQVESHNKKRTYTNFNGNFKLSIPEADINQEIHFFKENYTTTTSIPQKLRENNSRSKPKSQYMEVTMRKSTKTFAQHMNFGIAVNLGYTFPKFDTKIRGAEGGIGFIFAPDNDYFETFSPIGFITGLEFYAKNLSDKKEKDNNELTQYYYFLNVPTKIVHSINGVTINAGINHNFNIGSTIKYEKIDYSESTFLNNSHLKIYTPSFTVGLGYNFNFEDYSNTRTYIGISYYKGLNNKINKNFTREINGFNTKPFENYELIDQGIHINIIIFFK